MRDCILKFIRINLNFIGILFYWQNKAEGMIWNLLVMCLCISLEEGWINCTRILFVFSVKWVINILFVLYLIFLLFASLPWQGLKAGTKKQKYDKISEKKVSTPIEVSELSTLAFFRKLFHSVFSTSAWAWK